MYFLSNDDDNQDEMYEKAVIILPNTKKVLELRTTTPEEIQEVMKRMELRKVLVSHQRHA